MYPLKGGDLDSDDLLKGSPWTRKEHDSLQGGMSPSFCAMSLLKHIDCLILQAYLVLMSCSGMGKSGFALLWREHA
jgi:hypothetical protein